jgi:hypothetical protein
VRSPSSDEEPSVKPKDGAGQKSPNAGAGRQPLDREVLKAARSSRRPARVSWGGNAPRLCDGTRSRFIELTLAESGSQEETKG